MTGMMEFWAWGWEGGRAGGGGRGQGGGVQRGAGVVQRVVQHHSCFFTSVNTSTAASQSPASSAARMRVA